MSKTDQYFLKNIFLGLLLFFHNKHVRAFLSPPARLNKSLFLKAAKGFGDGAGFGASNNSKNKNPSNSNSKRSKKNNSKAAPKQAKATSTNRPFVKSEQEDLIQQLAQQAANTCIGRAVAAAAASGNEIDPFWELMPSLITSRFPKVSDAQLERIAGFIRHTLDSSLPLEDEIVQNPHRPQDEIHAYMPGLGPTQPFYDPQQLPLCRLLSDNYKTILSEYHALLDDMKQGGQDRSQCAGLSQDQVHQL